jgi:hypothetical protein
MAKDSLLEGFVQTFPGSLERSLADAFDALLTESDDSAADQLKTVLDQVLEGRTRATESD